MVLTANSDGAAGNGACFQWRPTADSATGLGNATAAAVIKPPYWVKIERKGDNLFGSISANGTTWTQLGTQSLTMADPVYIGICVTSHQAGEQRTFTFDSISATGGVTGSWQGAQISSPRYNDAAGLYAIVEDSSGAKKTVVHPDPAAAATGTWTLWPISLSDLTSAGVKANKVKKLTIGVGDRNSPKAGGTGMLYIDDIGYGSVATAAAGAKLDLKLAASTDDMEEYVASGSISGTSGDLELVYENSVSASTEQIVGVRYLVPVAKGAKIAQAYVEFTCDELTLGTQPVNLLIQGQLIANAPAFTTTARDISSRTVRTQAQVKWAVENWTTVGQKSQTPDLAPILQEIVDQAAWFSGNALVLIFSDDKSNPSKGLRCADAMEDQASNAGTAPVLHIELQ
jgi:hypothetical protein